MNWNKVINVLILLFAIVNVTLFVYKINYESNRYTLPEEREKQVSSALNTAGITLYLFVPDYYPQRQIELEAPAIDKEEIRRTILGDQVTITPDNTFGEKISNDNESLTFYTGEQEGYVYYKSEKSSYVPKDMTVSNVDDIVMEFAKDLYGSDVDMDITYRKSVEEDVVNGIDEGYRIELNEVFKDRIVFQSYIKLYITEMGIQEALAVRFKPIDYVGNSRNVYPFDEVMYNLMYYLEDELEAMDIEDNVPKKSIKDIDVGYYLLDIDRRKYVYNLDPHYRVIFESGETYYINAYTNVIINPE